MGAAPPTGNIYESADGDPQRQYGPGNRLLQKGNTKYEWDADGRLAEKREVTDDGQRVWSYAWNGAGLLQSVDTPDGKRVEFSYDPFARRMEKRVARVVDGDVQAEYATRFVWDGDVLAHEVRRTAAQSGDEIVEERAYVFEDGEFDPAAQRDGHTWLHYSNEINGAPNRLVNSRGESECEVERDAWGGTRIAGNASTPFGFAGQYRDEETGLSYNRARYYDAGLGRFVSADPVGIKADINDARYAQNALRWVDPSGHTRTCAGFVQGVQVKSHGKVVAEGTVDVRPTLDRIKSGGTFPHKNDGSVFKNLPPKGSSQPLLPQKPLEYYREYVHPTPGIGGPGPQRIVVGQGGEIYYTPDHYGSFVPLN